MSGEISLSQMIRELETAERRMRRALGDGLEQAAQLVEFEVKRRFGHDQDGWPALAPSTVEDRVKKGFDPARPLVRTGGLRDSYESQVDRSQLVAMVGSESPAAEAHEYGTERVPARPVLAAALADTGEEVAKIIGDSAAAALTQTRYRGAAFDQSITRGYRSADAKFREASIRLGNLRRAKNARAANVAARRAARAAARDAGGNGT